MTEIQCAPEQFSGRIIFMSMYNVIVWWGKGNKEMCITNSLSVAGYARIFAHGHWSFLGPGTEKKWYGIHTHKPNGEWDPDTLEVVLRTIISVNQLSVYGAVADMCDELASRISDCSESTGRLVDEDKSETMVVPTDLSTTTKPLLTNETVQGDLLREYERQFANLPDDIKLIRLCSDAGFVKTAAEGQFFVTQNGAEVAKLGCSCR